MRSKLKISGRSRSEIYSKAIKAIADFYGITEEDAEDYNAEIEVESTDYDHDKYYIAYVYCPAQ